MAYLEPADYPNYGLPAGTTADWITAATALINSYCRRPDLNVMQYTERLRVDGGARDGAAELSAACAAGHGNVAVGERARAAMRSRGAGELLTKPLVEVGVRHFRCRVSGRRSTRVLVDVDPNTGELMLPWNVLGLPYNEVKVTYTAGLATIGDDVKIGVRADCAQRAGHAGAECQQHQDRHDADAVLSQVRWWTRRCRRGCGRTLRTGWGER